MFTRGYIQYCPMNLIGMISCWVCHISLSIHWLGGGRERLGTGGIYIPYFAWAAKELLGVSEPHDGQGILESLIVGNKTIAIMMLEFRGASLTYPGGPKQI